MRKLQTCIACLTMALCSTAWAADVPAMLTVDGPALDHASHWTVGQLKDQLHPQSITFQSRGRSHRATAVSLLAVLQAAGVDTRIMMNPAADPKTKHRALRLAVLAKAADGYAVLFALPELLPEIGHREVWLALDQDGTPLSQQDGPTKLIVPDDAKPARWVHGMDELQVVDLSKMPTTQP